MELAAVGASGEGKAGQGAGDDVRAQPAWATAYGWQLYALLFKNAVLMVRQRAVLVTLVAVPALLVCVFGAILKASAFETVDTTPPVLMTMGGGATSLVRCTVYDQFGGQFGKHLPMRGYPCLTIAYAPDSEDVEALMRKMAEQTGLSFESDFRGFADRDALAQYFTRPEKPVHAALVFNTTLSRPHTVVDSLGASTVEDAFPYELWYNATVTDKVLSRNSGLDPLAEKTTSISGNQVRTRGWSGYVLAVQHAVNTALVALRVDPEASVDMKLRAFPFVSGPGFVDSEGIIRTIPIEQWGSMFYVIGVMTCFITALKQVAQEKDDRILDALRMMGLYESCYWLSWALYFMVISLLSTGLVLAAGAAFQIPYFVRTDAGVLFRVFWVFFFSMYAFALAVSSVVPNTKVATMTGFLFFALAVVVQLFLCLDVFPVVQFLYNPAVVSPLALRLINLYPAIGFSKIDRQIVAITSTKLNSSGLSFFDHYSSKLAQSSGAQFGFVQSGQTGVSVASIKCRGDNLTATEFFLNNCLHSEAYASSRSVCPEEEQKQSPLRLLEQSRRGGCAVTTRCTMEWVNAKARNIDDLLSRGDGRLLAFNLDRYTGADPSCAPGMSVVRSVLQLQNARNELVNVSVGFCSWTAEGCREAGGLPTSVYSGGVLRSTNCQCAYSIESENESLNGMLLTSAVWIVLAWYLGQVVTFGHGRGEWPWFPLTPWFWFSGVKNPLSGFCGSAPRVRRDASEQDDDVLAEERAVAEGAAALGRECPVVLQQMVKDFGRLSKFRAVDGLTLSLRSGECFVMLGHNGAGKSTAINMLSGMTSLSGGECTIYGKSVRDSMASIRHEVGVCPQHDILWGDLTAREHLLFYGHFQGMSSAAVRAQGERLLKQVHLDGLKRPAGNYSGGMKRRLSMTIAALGDKRVVFLDEPTTGLDPQNQRHVWDMINELKRGRVVILTTHLMDEADTLGDRIGIMSKGKLVALGNALHLKKKFGGNYKVAVTPADASKASAVAEVVAKTMPGAVFEGAIVGGGDAGVQPVRFVIEPKDFAKVPALFDAIDALVDKGAAKDWGLSQTSLEDVFVGLDEQRTTNDGAAAAGGAEAAAALTDATGHASSSPREAFSGVAFRPSTGKQVRALLRKSLTLQVRQRYTVCCQLIIPLGLIALMLLLINAAREDTSGTSSPTPSPSPAPVPLPEAYWFGAYMSNLDSQNGFAEVFDNQRITSLPSMHIVVAVTDPGIKDEVGDSCGQDVYGTFDSSSSGKYPRYTCGDSCRTGQPRPIAAVGLDGADVTPLSSSLSRCPNPEQPLHWQAQCQFDASDPLSEVARNFSNDGGSGLLRFFPARLVRHRYKGRSSNDTYMRDARLCAVELAPLFKAPANGDMAQAVSDLLIDAQVARTTSQAPFDKPVSLDFAGWQRARELLNGYFPDGALVFDKLNKGVSFTYQSYFSSAEWSPDCQEMGGAYSAATVSAQTRESEATGSQSGFQPRGCSKTLVGRAGHDVGLQGTLQVINSASFVLNGITSAVLSQGGSRRAQVSVGLRKMPGTVDSRPEDPSRSSREEKEEGLILVLAGLFVPLATTFLLPVLVFHVVYEKEAKLRATMLMMGLKVHVYWAVQYLFDMALTMTVMLLVYIAVSAARVSLYTKHSFGIALLLLVLWANALVALSFLLSVAFSRTRNATIALYMLVFVAVFSSFAMQEVVFAARPNVPAPAYWIWFPPFAYYRANHLLGSRTYTWASLSGDELQRIFVALVLESIVCFLATYYLDQVLPKEYGVRRHPLFCVRDVMKKGAGSVDAEEQLVDDAAVKEDPESPAGDQDVAQERRLVLSGGAAPAPIRVIDIKKRFGDFKAVDGVTLHFENGCSAMLGPNGAGKSTVISMLTGLYSPSAGDAFIAGHSVRTGMNQIYSSIGVCPQHDVTYADLTVVEHLLLYARLKGVDAADERPVVDNALSAVMLREHASKRAGKLSGGQRRRLSIAIAFIGNPAVVFLDEPTTGTDPVTRSQVHELVLQEKRRRCVLLTTHLMSEAEKLCDRIAIMAHGKLVTIGTSQELKSKYNDGFKITVVVSERERARRFIEAQFPGCELESEVNQRLVFKFPLSAKVTLAKVWAAMLGKAASNGITDWQISATTLEDVFIAIAKDSEARFGTA